MQEFSNAGIVKKRAMVISNLTMSDDKEGTSVSKQEREDIDTTLPYYSVMEAVSLFGGKADLKKSKFQKSAARAASSDHAHQELPQLENAEDMKAELPCELADARKSFEFDAGKLEETNGSTSMIEGCEDAIQNIEKTDQGPTHTEEKQVVWEAQLRVIKENHMNVLAELDSARRGLTDLKQELLAFLREKGSFKLAEAALAAAEDNTKKAEDLNAELEVVTDALTLLNLSCIHGNKGDIVLSEAKQLDLKALNDDTRELGSSYQESKIVSYLEAKLVAMKNELEGLQKELKRAKEGEVKLTAVATEALANLEASRFEFERTSMPEENDNSFCPRILVGAKLTVEKENGASLLSILELLRIESGMMKNNLTGLKEREGNATSKADVVLAGLPSLEPAASELVETSTIESISGLSQALERVQPDERKIEFPQEASKARSDAEQDKFAMQNAESMWLTVFRDADVAEVAEAAEIECAKSFFARGSEVEAGIGMTISEAEYNYLKRKAQEADELANARVAAATAEMETARASEQEVLQKATMLMEDMENIKAAIQEALHRAEMAEAAKAAMDRELMRLRGRKQRRKEKAMAMASQQHYAKNEERNLFASVTQEPQVELLANFLNINRASEDSNTMVRTSSHKLSKPFSNLLGSYLGKRRTP